MGAGSINIQPYSGDTKDDTAKLTLFSSVYFTSYTSKRSRFKRIVKNTPTEAQQVSTVVQVTTTSPSVPVNIFIGKIQGILVFTNTQVRVLVDDGYDSQEPVLYWKFTDIKEWYQLKFNIPARFGGISF